MSDMNPFTKRGKGGAWVIPLTIVGLLIGWLGSVAWTMRQEDTNIRNGLSPEQRSLLDQESVKLVEQVADLQKEVQTLREDNTRITNAVADTDKATKELNKSLQDVRLFAGLTEIEGPGVRVTLRDSSKPKEEEFLIEAGIIHDTDILRVVNELWSSGAEAISVNKMRLGPKSCVRCVGPTVLVDSTRLASPFVIQAVGDTDTLMGGLSMPGGVLDELRDIDPNMVLVEAVKSHRLPSYTGTTTLKYGKLPEEPQ